MPPWHEYQTTTAVGKNRERFGASHFRGNFTSSGFSKSNSDSEAEGAAVSYRVVHGVYMHLYISDFTAFTVYVSDGAFLYLHTNQLRSPPLKERTVYPSLLSGSSKG